MGTMVATCLELMAQQPTHRKRLAKSGCGGDRLIVDMGGPPFLAVAVRETVATCATLPPLCQHPGFSISGVSCQTST